MYQMQLFRYYIEITLPGGIFQQRKFTFGFHQMKLLICEHARFCYMYISNSRFTGNYIVLVARRLGWGGYGRELTGDYREEVHKLKVHQ